MRFAVLGLGSIGRRHAGNLLALGQQTLGFDVDPAGRKALEEAGGKTVAERDAALEWAADGGTVVVASPNGQHRTDVLDALSAGSHVFVEKPFAHRLDGLAEAVDQAQANGQIVFAAHNLRYHPAVEDARKLLDQESPEEGYLFKAFARKEVQP